MALVAVWAQASIAIRLPGGCGSTPGPWFHYAIEKRLGLDGVPLSPDDCPLGAQPPMWYLPAWPTMRAFALPSFSEGYVRINVKGRDAAGIVEPADYDRVYDEISAELYKLRTRGPAGS